MKGFFNLYNFLEEMHDCDFLGLTETWKIWSPTEQHPLTGHKTIHSGAIRERLSRGISFFIKDSYSVDILNQSSRWIFVLVKYNSISLILGLVYTCKSDFLTL